LFAQSCEFVLGVAGADQLPDASLPEVAFAGRSNVGKSSLVNALTGRKTLARVSNAPGRTRQLNFFTLGERLMLVDLPGYGYAKAPRSEAKRWTDLTEAYLRGRPNLRRVCLLIDARRGVVDSDRELMAMLDAAAVPYQAVLTKCDKLSQSQLARLTDALEGELSGHGAAAPRTIATSARAPSGIAELRADLAAISRDWRSGGDWDTVPPP
jgi:GTP-binding protein